MSCNDLNSLDLDLGKRDDRRRMARCAGLKPSFGEKLVGVAYDADGEAMLVDGVVNGTTTGTRAFCTNPTGRRAPVFEGTPGVWSGPAGHVENAPAILGFDISTIESAYLLGAESSLVVADPQDLVKPDPSTLMRSFLDGGVAEEVLARHHKGAGMIIASVPDSRVHQLALDILAWSIAKCGYFGPIVRAPRFDLKQFANPGHPKRVRIARLIEAASTVMRRQMESRAGLLDESSRPRDGRAAA